MILEVVKTDFRPLWVIFKLETCIFEHRKLVYGRRKPVYGPRKPLFGLRKPVDGPRKPVYGPENLYMDPNTHIRGVSGGGLRPPHPPLAPPARVMLVRGCAEYRRSLPRPRNVRTHRPGQRNVRSQAF